MSTKGKGNKRQRDEEEGEKSKTNQSKLEPTVKKTRAEEPTVEKKKLGDYYLLQDAVGTVTVDIEDPKDFIDRLYFKKVNSQKSRRWNVFVWAKNSDGSISKDCLQKIRFKVPMHRIRMVPKKFKEGEKIPYAFSVPLTQVEKHDSFDNKMRDFFDQYRKHVAAYLESEEAYPEGMTAETLEDPAFYKGPVSSWSMGTDFKCRFEYHIGEWWSTRLCTSVRVLVNFVNTVLWRCYAGCVNKLD